MREENVRSVLIVDEDTAFAANLVAALAQEYMVIVVNDGLEAIRIVQHYTVDVVLLDLVTSECDCFALLGRLGSMNRGPCVVVLSGVSEVTKVVKAMRLGARDYLVKPCDSNAVRKAVGEVLAD